MDLKERRGTPDRSRINASELYEVVYWSTAFNVPEHAVQRAANAVGPMLVNVKKWLKWKGYM